MINYQKLLTKLEEAGITTYTIRQQGLIPQGTLAKFKMCSSCAENPMQDIQEKLEKYKAEHDGKEFKYDVSTKTIEDICQLLQCQPQDILDWQVELDSDLAFRKASE